MPVKARPGRTGACIRLPGMAGAGRLAGSAAAIGCLAFGASHAAAQSALPVIQPTIPPDYNQDRNVSVLEQPRPDYDALGIRLGAFLAYPSLDLSVAASDNVYLAPSNKTSDGFAIVQPAIIATSDWSRHQVRLSASGAFRRYFDQVPLNRNEYDVRSLGRLHIGDYSSATVEGQISRLREEPFPSQLHATLDTLSSYQRTYVTARAERQAGRFRLIGAVDRTGYTFSPIHFTDDTRQSQVDRNRDITSVAGQVEYARSPGAVFFAQATFSRSDYRRNLLLSGGPNRDSDSERIIGGLNLDLPGLIRGTVGLGYSRRDFSSAMYRTVSGFSAQVELTYFVSRLTNLRLAAHRVIDDSAFADNSAFFDTQVGLGVDHELRRNIIVGANANYGWQNYFDSPLGYKVYRIDANAQYLLSRRLRLRLEGGYGRRDRTGSGLKQVYDEASGRLTLGLQI